MDEKKLHALEFSLTIGCRMDCRYCPQSLLLSRYYDGNPQRESTLSFDNFKKILVQVRDGAEISFAGMAEPFANPKCADMIVYAHEHGFKISLLTTLVGMTRKDFEKIKNIPFDSFVLHIPDEEMKSKVPITEEYLYVLKSVIKNINIDYYSCHGSVHEKVRNLIDRDKYAGLALGNRAGNLNIPEAPSVHQKTGRIVCYHGSEKQVGGWSPVMFPDGTLVLCCMDYGMKHQLGNLLKQNWEEIAESKEYTQFLRGLEDDTKDILCRTCSDAIAMEQLPAMIIREMTDEIKQSTAVEREGYPLLFRELSDADTVCVYGMGKLFSDHFFQQHWNEGLRVNLLADRSVSNAGMNYNGIKCVNTESLSNCNVETTVVIPFVKNAEGIISALKKMGFRKIFPITEIVNQYEKWCGHFVKW